MIAAGIMILLGVVLDFAVHGFSGIHILFVICGLFLILINSIRTPKLKGGSIAKSILSLAALALTCLLVAGLLPSISSGTSDTTAGEIKKATQMAEKNGVAEAAAYLDEIVQKGPWNRDLAFAAAELFSKYGKFSDSTGRYIAMLAYVPYDVEVRYALARSQMGSKDYNGAIDQLTWIIQYDPQNPDVCEALGDAYWAKGDNIRGIYYYKMAVNQVENDVEKRVKLAQAYANMHSDAEAMVQYAKAKELAKTFEEEMLVYNGYTSMKGASSLQDSSADSTLETSAEASSQGSTPEASTEASSLDKEAGK